MSKFLAMCCISLFTVCAVQTSAQEKQTLRLVQTIPLPGVKRELIKSWPARGDGAGDMALDPARHRLFVGTRTPPEMTVYDSLSGKEIQNLPGPETMDGVYYDAKLNRVYMTGGRWYGTSDASPGWVYVYQQKGLDHYEVISKIKIRPGSGTPLLVTQLNRFYVASQAIGDQEAAILVFEPVQ